MLEDVGSGDQDSVIATLMKDVCLIFNIFSGCHCCFPAARRKGWLPLMRRDSLAKMGHKHIWETNIFVQRPLEKLRILLKHTMFSTGYQNTRRARCCVVSTFNSPSFPFQPLSGAHHHPRHSHHSGWPATCVEPWRAMTSHGVMASEQFWGSNSPSRASSRHSPTCEQLCRKVEGSHITQINS